MAGWSKVVVGWRRTARGRSVSEIGRLVLLRQRKTSSARLKKETEENPIGLREIMQIIYNCHLAPGCLSFAGPHTLSLSPASK